MKFLIQLVLTLAMIALTTLAVADNGIPVNSKYAGYGHDMTVEMVEDGYFANLTHAKGKGTFGNSTMVISVEFMPDESQIANCSEGYDLSFAVVPDNFWAFITTAPDHSQVFGLFNSGWLCMTADRMHWEGQTQGFFFGGTGRYEGAEGTWVSNYQGVNLDPVTGLRSITGDVIGTLYLP